MPPPITVGDYRFGEPDQAKTAEAACAAAIKHWPKGKLVSYGEIAQQMGLGGIADDCLDDE